jgi:hypothetical protein
VAIATIPAQRLKSILMKTISFRHSFDRVFRLMLPLWLSFSDETACGPRFQGQANGHSG